MHVLSYYVFCNFKKHFLSCAAPTVGSSMVVAPTDQSSYYTSIGGPKGDRNSNLALILCLVGGIVIISIISMIFICSCVLHEEKPKPLRKDSGTGRISLSCAM